MKDQLAERLLAKVMGWGGEEIAQYGSHLQALAGLKYDEYEQFGPGEKFLESFAAWLWQFDPAEREVATRLVLDRLVFISRAELDHAIEIVYPDLIEPLLRKRAAAEAAVEPYRVTQIQSSDEFRDLQRKTLVLGLADGARLDRFRRASAALSHEQFHMTADPGEDAQRSLRSKLEAAIERLGLRPPALFRQVLLVNDFAGSGYTLLHEGAEGGWAGKLWDVRTYLEGLQGTVISEDCAVTVVLYVATETGLDYLKRQLAAAALEWDVVAAQVLGAELEITDPETRELARHWFDEVLNDEHMQKGGTEPHLGFGGQALPVVLSHNAPNNSIGLLWGDSREIVDSRKVRALFPRRLRHATWRP